MHSVFRVGGLALVAFLVGCSDSGREPLVEPLTASAVIQDALEALDSDQFADGWTASVTQFPDIGSPILDSKIEACRLFTADMAAVEATRVSHLWASGAMEGRKRNAKGQGYFAVMVTAHDDAERASEYLERFFEALSSEANGACTTGMTATTLKLSIERREASVSAPTGGFGRAQTVRSADGRYVTMQEDYGWRRGNLAIFVLISVDEGLHESVDLRKLVEQADSAVQDAMK